MNPTVNAIPDKLTRAFDWLQRNYCQGYGFIRPSGLANFSAATPWSLDGNDGQRIGHLLR